MIMNDNGICVYAKLISAIIYRTLTGLIAVRTCDAVKSPRMHMHSGRRGSEWQRRMLSIYWFSGPDLYLDSRLSSVKCALSPLGQLQDILGEGGVRHLPSVSGRFHDFHIRRGAKASCRCRLSECFPFDEKRKIWASHILNARSPSWGVDLTLNIMRLSNPPFSHPPLCSLAFHRLFFPDSFFFSPHFSKLPNDSLLCSS